MDGAQPEMDGRFRLEDLYFGQLRHSRSFPRQESAHCLPLQQRRQERIDLADQKRETRTRLPRPTRATHAHSDARSHAGTRTHGRQSPEQRRFRKLGRSRPRRLEVEHRQRLTFAEHYGPRWTIRRESHRRCQGQQTSVLRRAQPQSRHLHLHLLCLRC